MCTTAYLRVQTHVCNPAYVCIHTHTLCVRPGSHVRVVHGHTQLWYSHMGRWPGHSGAHPPCTHTCLHLVHTHILTCVCAWCTLRVLPLDPATRALTLDSALW